jgi:hypothetical protein
MLFICDDLLLALYRMMQPIGGGEGDDDDDDDDDESVEVNVEQSLKLVSIE